MLPKPPTLAKLTIVVMIVVHLTLPRWQLITSWWRLIGVALFALGVWLAASGRSTFVEAKTPVPGSRTPTTLVTHGPFHHTRNPMYLGMSIALLGVAVGLGSATPFLFPPAFLLTMLLRHVLPEEQKMERLFGEAYRRYKRRVRRWL